MGQGLELVILKTQGCTSPVGGGAADSLHDPCGQVREIVRHAPAARCRALVEPCELGKTIPFIIDKIFELVAFSGFENDDVDAFLGQFVCRACRRQRPSR